MKNTVPRSLLTIGGISIHSVSWETETWYIESFTDKANTQLGWVPRTESRDCSGSNALHGARIHIYIVVWNPKPSILQWNSQAEFNVIFFICINNEHVLNKFSGKEIKKNEIKCRIYVFWNTSTWVIGFQKLVERYPSSSNANHDRTVQEPHQPNILLLSKLKRADIKSNSGSKYTQHL